jgi:nicotinate-nucleotide pyrophosphorylase (carboxylating)
MGYERVHSQGWGDDLSLPALVRRALAEDVGSGDLTAEATVRAEARGRARIVQKQPGVVFGFEAAREVFRQAGAGELEPATVEGRWREDVPVDVATVGGPARALLAGERVALNLLGHLSGVATATARMVRAAREGGSASILDTRKTTPGLRALEKAAVRAGGGHNHRMGLFDAILIKENHIALAGGLAAAVAAAREAHPDLPLEVECRDATEVAAALDAGADRLLLDNMDPPALEAAVAARREAGYAVTLEASGGVDLDSVAAIAATGVDFISVGALTHSTATLDLSMLLEPA